SYHCALAAVLWSAHPRRLWGRMALGVWAAGVAVACILTRQHYVVDVVAGIALGLGAARIADRARSSDAWPVRRPVRRFGLALGTGHGAEGADARRRALPLV